MYHTLLEGVWLSGIGRMTEVRNVPRLAWCEYRRIRPFQRCGTFTLPEMLNPTIFRAKTFNIFYVFGREEIPTSSIRAPIKPRKFPQKHLENPEKHIEFSTSDVFLPLYRPKKEEKVPCLGLSPLR